MSEKPKLSRTDWIKAAYRALTAAGPQAIRVESIARELKVSKGSFYWHFKDLAALKTAMIEHWLDLGTRQIIAGLEDGGASPRERLKQLMILARSDNSRPYGGPKVEAAIRDWARYDDFVKASVENIDCQRVDYATGLMAAAGAEQIKARRSANILYATLVGLEQFSGQDKATAKEVLLATLELLLADIPDVSQ